MRNGAYPTTKLSTRVLRRKLNAIIADTSDRTTHIRGNNRVIKIGLLSVRKCRTRSPINRQFAMGNRPQRDHRTLRRPIRRNILILRRNVPTGIVRMIRYNNGTSLATRVTNANLGLTKTLDPNNALLVRKTSRVTTTRRKQRFFRRLYPNMRHTRTRKNVRLIYQTNNGIRIRPLCVRKRIKNNLDTIRRRRHTRNVNTNCSLFRKDTRTRRIKSRNGNSRSNLDDSLFIRLINNRTTIQTKMRMSRLYANNLYRSLPKRRVKIILNGERSSLIPHIRRVRTMTMHRGVRKFNNILDRRSLIVLNVRRLYRPITNALINVDNARNRLVRTPIKINIIIFMMVNRNVRRLRQILNNNNAIRVSRPLTIFIDHGSKGVPTPNVIRFVQRHYPTSLRLPHMPHPTKFPTKSYPIPKQDKRPPSNNIPRPHSNHKDTSGAIFPHPNNQ